jgi:tritrans,polycis-undecaprenyl-diphosphate synthase [geranylgeranyl-diphosphate specific]
MDLHIGIIPDGNRRFAKKNDKSICELYEQGYQKFRELIDEWSEKKTNEHIENNKDSKIKHIKHISFYVCSKDNLTKRPQVEIDLIHKMLNTLIVDFESDRFQKNTVKINLIGNLNLLPKNITKALNNVQKKSKNNDKLFLNLAIAYDGREDIIKKFKKMDKISNKTTENMFGKDIDLVIRTGYEKRTSSFFPWQTVYSEWFFLDKFWPEFTIDDLEDVLIKYYKIERRFGK